jgi:hypothetical protein
VWGGRVLLRVSAQLYNADRARFILNVLVGGLVCEGSGMSVLVWAVAWRS